MKTCFRLSVFCLLFAVSAPAFAQSMERRDAIVLFSDTSSAARLRRTALVEAMRKAGFHSFGMEAPVFQGQFIPGESPLKSVIVAGYCSREESAAVLKLIQEKVEPGAYIREVERKPEELASHPCPTLAPRAYLLLRSAARREALARDLKSAQRSTRLTFAAGYPAILEGSAMAPGRKGADAFSVVLGVCPVEQIETLTAVFHDSFGPSPLYVPTEAPEACPEPSPQQAGSAAHRAVDRLDGVALLRWGQLVTNEGERTSLVESALRTGNRDIADAAMSLGRFRPSAVDGIDWNKATPEFAGWAVARLFAVGDPFSSYTDYSIQTLMSASPATLAAVLPQIKKPGFLIDVLLSTQGNVQTLNKLLDNGLDLSKVELDPRHVAEAKPELLSVLIARGLSLDRRSAGLTFLDGELLLPWPEVSPQFKVILSARPALKAAYDGDVAALAGLEPAALDAPFSGWAPLQVAALRGHVKVVEHLLEAGAQVDRRVGSEESESLGGDSALTLAIRGGHEEVVALLLRKKPDLRITAGVCCYFGELSYSALPLHMRDGTFKRSHAYASLTGWNGYRGLSVRRWTPLVLAILSKQPRIAGMLVDAGANLGAPPGKGLSPLLAAALMQRQDLVDGLMQKGAQESPTQLLRFALRGGGNKALVDSLLKLGGDEIARAPGILTEAAVHADHDTVERFLKLGAGGNGEGERAMTAICDEGETSLHSVYELLRKDYGDLKNRGIHQCFPDLGY